MFSKAFVSIAKMDCSISNTFCNLIRGSVDYWSNYDLSEKWSKLFFWLIKFVLSSAHKRAQLNKTRGGGSGSSDFRQNSWRLNSFWTKLPARRSIFWDFYCILSTCFLKICLGVVLCYSPFPPPPRLPPPVYASIVGLWLTVVRGTQR